MQALAAAAAKLIQSCLALCDHIDGSPPDSPVPGILQARTLEWVAISFSNAWKWKVKMKSCPIPSDPMDCSSPGSSIHGSLQARVLEWGAIAFSCKHLRITLLSNLIGTSLSVWYFFIPIFQLYKLYFKQLENFPQSYP